MAQDKFTVEMTTSQLWITLRALLLLTGSDYAVIIQEFPNTDIDLLAEDVDDLVSALQAAAKP